MLAQSAKSPRCIPRDSLITHECYAFFETGPFPVPLAEVVIFAEPRQAKASWMGSMKCLKASLGVRPGTAASLGRSG